MSTAIKPRRVTFGINEAPKSGGNSPTSAVLRKARPLPELPTQPSEPATHPPADSNDTPVSHQDTLDAERRQRIASAQAQAERLAVDAMMVARSMQKSIHRNHAARKDGRPPPARAVDHSPTPAGPAGAAPPSPALSSASSGGNASPLAPLLPAAMDPVAFLGRILAGGRPGPADGGAPADGGRGGGGAG